MIKKFKNNCRYLEHNKTTAKQKLTFREIRLTGKKNVDLVNQTLPFWLFILRGSKNQIKQLQPNWYMQGTTYRKTLLCFLCFIFFQNIGQGLEILKQTFEMQPVHMERKRAILYWVYSHCFRKATYFPWGSLPHQSSLLEKSYIGFAGANFLLWFHSEFSCNDTSLKVFLTCLSSHCWSPQAVFSLFHNTQNLQWSDSFIYSLVPVMLLPYLSNFGEIWFCFGQSGSWHKVTLKQYIVSLYNSARVIVLLIGHLPDTGGPRFDPQNSRRSTDHC